VFGILGLDIEKKQGIVQNAQQSKTLILKTAAGQIHKNHRCICSIKKQKIGNFYLGHYYPHWFIQCGLFVCFPFGISTSDREKCINY